MHFHKCTVLERVACLCLLVTVMLNTLRQLHTLWQLFDFFFILADNYFTVNINDMKVTGKVEHIMMIMWICHVPLCDLLLMQEVELKSF